MAQPQKLVVAIHDLHPWGGQDKSNLEILYHLNHSLPIDLHAFTFVDQRPWPQAHHEKYQAPLQRPLFFKLIYYSLRSFFKLRRYGSPRVRHAKGLAIQSTGTASWIADVVQVQFIHQTWRSIQKEHPIPAGGGFLKSFYQDFLSLFNAFEERRLYNNRKQFIAISHSIKKELMTHFHIDEENIHTIYHGVDPDFFHPPNESDLGRHTRERLRQELGLSSDDIVLLHVGALNERKGLSAALSTLSILKKAGMTNIKYVAVGGGDRSFWEQVARREQVEDQFIIVSHSKSVRDFYWASDIFFFPSIYEPFGLVILEAMATGLPCLVSSQAGASELIDHGDNGLLIENIFNPQAMAHQIQDLVKHPQSMQKLRQGARAAAFDRSWKNVAHEYRVFYDSYFK